MTGKRAARWHRLDNAAKIFPPNSSKADPKVFRFACELRQPVEREPLQAALEETLQQFPFYRCVMKKGLFWYYLEDSLLKPVVHEENKPPCSPRYQKNRKTLLFSVTYYHCRINLEVYHVLSDGTGALHFLRTLTVKYLALRHPEAFPNGAPALDYDASWFQKQDDSFLKYYKRTSFLERGGAKPAYRIRGEHLPDNRIQVIEGVTSIKQCLSLARQRGATLTTLLVAVLMCSIQQEMPARAAGKPVVISVPVNLRKYFPSESARNFFGVIDISCDFSGGTDLAYVTKLVTDALKKELTEEALRHRMNKLSALEHSWLIRPIPLVIKDQVLRFSAAVSEREETAALTNIGPIWMPEETVPYIRLFDAFTSTNRIQISLCSFQDNLVISYTSSFMNTDIPRRFFRALSALGLPVEVSASALEGGELL